MRHLRGDHCPEMPSYATARRNREFLIKARDLTLKTAGACMFANAQSLIGRVGLCRSVSPQVSQADSVHRLRLLDWILCPCKQADRERESPGSTSPSKSGTGLNG